MKNGGNNAWPWYGRRFIAEVVDVLIGAATFAVAYAAIGTATDLRDVVIAGAIALLGIGLLIEPNVSARPAGGAGGISPQPLRQLTEPEGARPEPQAMGVATP
jgi:hypothetical protein